MPVSARFRRRFLSVSVPAILAIAGNSGATVALPTKLFGDGMVGFPQGAPYAGIIAAAGGNDLPAAWIDQLAVGGRLVAPAVTAAGRQNLVVVDKTANGVVRTELEAVHFVPLKSGVV